MAYRDLREYLQVLENAGKLHRIRAEVDKTWEIAAVSRLTFQDIPEEQRPALMFDRVRGHSIPLCVGVLGASRSVYALALETAPEGIPEKWARAQRNPIPSRRLDSGPVHEEVKRGEAATCWSSPCRSGRAITIPGRISRRPA